MSRIHSEPVSLLLMLFLCFSLVPRVAAMDGAFFNFVVPGDGEAPSQPVQAGNLFESSVMGRVTKLWTTFNPSSAATTVDLNLYDALPTPTLLTQCNITSAGSPARWVSCEVSDLVVISPGQQFFVAVQHRDTQKIMNKYLLSQVSFGHSHNGFTIVSSARDFSPPSAPVFPSSWVQPIAVDFSFIIPTSLSTPSELAQPICGEAITVRSTLSTSASVPIQGQTILFVAVGPNVMGLQDSANCTATTDVLGVAQCQLVLPLPNTEQEPYQLQAIFSPAPHTPYTASSSQSELEVSSAFHLLSGLVYTGSASISNVGYLLASARLPFQGSLPSGMRAPHVYFTATGLNGCSAPANWSEEHTGYTGGCLITGPKEDGVFQLITHFSYQPDYCNVWQASTINDIRVVNLANLTFALAELTTRMVAAEAQLQA